MNILNYIQSEEKTNTKLIWRPEKETSAALNNELHTLTNAGMSY